MHQRPENVYFQNSINKRNDFIDTGIISRKFFPHVIFRIPKAGPDSAYVCSKIVDKCTDPEFWTVTIHADGQALEGFPERLFFDDDLIWHRQQYGKPGHVAYATLVETSETLHVLNMVSDVVQRQSLVPEFRSRIQNRFSGWPAMLLNALLNFAVDRSIKCIKVPRSHLARSTADPNRIPKPPLLERVYDEAVQATYSVSEEADWWVLDVLANKHRAVRAERVTEPVDLGPQIVILHDTERGLGHLDVEPEFASAIEEPSNRFLSEMLRIESAMGWRTSYSVVGSIFNEVAPHVKAGGHSLSFHSFDHDIERKGDQLSRCREVDFRTRGYRPPRSILTEETRPAALQRLGFDTLISSAGSIDLDQPALRQQIAMIPVQLDDFPLHIGELDLGEWRTWARSLTRDHPVMVLGLHDCYANHWLQEYPAMLDELAQLSSPATIDDISNQLFLSNAV